MQFSSNSSRPQRFETIHVNADDTDETTDADLAVEAAPMVQVPRIAECPVNLECRLKWHRPLCEGSRWRLLAGRAVHVEIAENATAGDALSALSTG